MLIKKLLAMSKFSGHLYLVKILVKLHVSNNSAH